MIEVEYWEDQIGCWIKVDEHSSEDDAHARIAQLRKFDDETFIVRRYRIVITRVIEV